MHKRVLILDDDQLSRKTLSLLLESEGFEVVQAADAEEAAGMVEKCPVEVALLDVRLPGMQGDEFGLHLRRRCPDTRILFISGELKVDRLDRFGPDAKFFSKPLDIDALLATI